MADTDFNALTATNTIAATDSLVLVRAGTPYRFTGSLPVINATGYMGIGAANPTARLHIHGGGGDDPRANFTNGAGANAFVGISNGNQLDIWNNANAPIRLGVAGAEAGRIGSDGNLLIGRPTTLNASFRAHFDRSGANANYVAVGNSSNGMLFGVAADGTGRIMSYAGAAFSFGNFSAGGTPTVHAGFDTSGHLLPGADNARNLGSGSLRFGTVYAGTSTINTSDAMLKTVRGGLSVEEIAWAQAIRVLAYRFNDAIAEKGDEARIHFGVIAQEVHAAGLAAGIADPFAYAFLCLDPLFEQVEVMEPQLIQKTEPFQREATSIVVENGLARQVTTVIDDERLLFELLPLVDEAGTAVMIASGEDEDGAPVLVQATHQQPVMVMRDVPVTRDVPVLDGQGNQVMRWGIRYEELAMFLLAASAAPHP